MQALNIAEYAILNATKCYCVDYTFSDQSISLFDRNPRIPNDLSLEDLAEKMQNCITSLVCNWRLLNVGQLLHEKEIDSGLLGYAMGFALKKILKWMLIIVGFLAGMFFVGVQLVQRSRCYIERVRNRTTCRKDNL